MPTLGKTKVSPSLISTGSLFLGTSSYAVTASYAMNGGSGGSAGSTQTGSIANQTVLYNVTTSQDNTITGLNLSSNKWGVTVVEEWNSIPGDLNISSCSLLMHFSGSNGSTTFIDNSPNNFTVSANGNTKITSSISKFGGSSAYFDGTGDNLLINYNTALHLSGDFTIEVWFYPISLNASNLLNFAGGLNIAWASYLLFVSGDVYFAASSANNGYDIGSEGTGAGTIGTPTLNAWNHIAVTRQGNVYRGFINGVQGYTQTLALTPYNPNARGLAIGGNYANTWGGTPVSSINGYLDEFRITKGVARYTASFATQSVQFPDSLPQYETKYVGLVGGLNDTGSDYGVQKLDDTSLKIRKMSVSGTPVSGSPILSASVDRVYVNVLNYDNVSISGSISNAISSSYSLTASYNLNSVSSSFSTTSSYNLNSISSSYALTASFSLNGGGGGTTLTTGSTYPITSSWATTSSNIIGGTSNYIPLWSTNTSLGNSVLYQSSNNIGIGTTSPADKLQVAVGNISVDSGYRYYMDANIGAASIRKSGSSMVFSVGSSDRVYIDSNGGVGIGTSIPASKLDVADDFNGGNQILVRNINAGSSAYAALILKRNADVNGLVLFTNSSTRTADGGAGNSTIRTDTGKLLLGAAGTTYHAIDTNGNVGIGTTSPSYKLDVNGIIAVSNSPFADKTGNYNRIYNPSGDGCIYLGNVSDPGNYYDNTNHYFRNRGNTTTYVTINSNGNVGIGTTSPASILHLQSSAATTLLRIDNTNNANDAAILLTDSTNPTGEGFRITYDSSVGDTYFNNIFTSSIQAFNFQKGDFGSGTSLLTILNSGNVGIGTTSPSAKLHVNGNISASAFTGSVFGTSSWANNATTASFASTASYNLNSVSSSYSLTASFSLNGGGGGTTLTTGSTYPITSSWATNSITASYAMNGGGGGSVQTGNIANQTILYNVTTSQDNTITGLNLSSNKWGVTVVEEWNSGSIVGDEYYNSCSLLLHFSGSNGSTTFVDNSPSPKTATSNNGASISTAQSKFGSTSGLFDGSDDYVTVPDNSAFDFGAGDFTIEYWEYRTASTAAKPTISRNNNPQAPWMLGYSYNGNINLFAGNGSSWTIASEVSMGTIIINSWTHYAVTRQGNTFRTFQNGIQISTFTSAATLPDGAAPLQIGRYATTALYPGYLDELRLTKGVARYTGNFATQSVEFYNNASVSQLQTKYIGLVGGLNDSNVDYGVEKLSDSSLKIRKMTASGQPLSGSGALSASVDRVYVNVLDYTNVMVTSSYALTASYVLGGIQTGSISNQTILYNVTTSQDNTITGLDLSGNKWDVSVIEEWNSGSIVGDEYYNSCSLLMHFSGSNGSTTFIDNSPRTKTFTVNGNSQISTAQSKFGSSSLLLDGSGDYLTFPANSEFAFGTGNFTIECWIYFSAGSTYRGIFSTRATNLTSVTTNGSFGVNPENGIFLWTNTFIINYTTNIGTNQWVHVALCRNGSSLKAFANGTEVGSVTYTDNLTGNLATIGSNGDGSEAFNGYIDELRITKGVARYTGSFVTQSTAFLDSQNLNQLQTKYVGLVGGINDSTVDYGVEKLSDGSLKIRKMSVSGQPLSGSGALSASVDRVYVNVLNYKEVQTTAQSASYAVSASYLINAASGESFHPFLLG